MQHSNTNTNESEQSLYFESDSTVKFFTKRKGTANVGQFYESKLLSMVCFRLRHDEQVEDFFLGNNLDETGAFDDIVVRTIVGGRSHILCLQAKHKEPGSQKFNFDWVCNQDLKGDLNLLKYFDSYLKIRYMFSPDSDHAIFQGEYDQTELELIIFTTGILNNSDSIQYLPIPSDNKLYTKQSGKTIKIDCTDRLLETFVKYSIDWHRKNVKGIMVKLIEAIECDPSNILPSQNEHKRIVHDFFDKLRFYTEQATQKELDDVIKMDIKNKGFERNDLIFTKFHDNMVHWWEQTGQVHF